MLVLAMCGVFLLVIPAIAYLLALLGNYLRRDTKTPDKMTRL
ncbi:MAG TPA: hypothetical protein VGZ93_02140 [Candidatus Methylacidiphilales bacterium]|nr:hypothetical protein [Candidatus Methylacidiphilales bacterium]